MIKVFLKSYSGLKFLDKDLVSINRTTSRESYRGMTRGYKNTTQPRISKKEAVHIDMFLKGKSEPEKAIIKYFLKVLSSASRLSKTNKMTSNNLARTFISIFLCKDPTDSHNFPTYIESIGKELELLTRLIDQSTSLRQYYRLGE